MIKKDIKQVKNIAKTALVLHLSGVVVALGISAYQTHKIIKEVRNGKTEY
jgi:hypothetical protein